MAVIRMQLYAKTLGVASSVHIILPQPKHAETFLAPLPVLTLLHGMGDDDSAWIRKTNIERYAIERGLAVIMPDGELSCYENMLHGGNYRDYILHELPEIMHSCFPLSAERSKNFIAGCSMGGFGALKLGLAAPEKWSAIGCFSAAHMEYRPASPRNSEMLARDYGDTLPEIEAQIERDALDPAKPPLTIWHGWGDRDALRDNALVTRDFLKDAPNINYHCEELPGIHDWALWDEMARRFILSLKLTKPEVRLL